MQCGWKRSPENSIEIKRKIFHYAVRETESRRNLFLIKFNVFFFPFSRSATTYYCDNNNNNCNFIQLNAGRTHTHSSWQPPVFFSACPTCVLCWLFIFVGFIFHRLQKYSCCLFFLAAVIVVAVCVHV